MIRVAPLFDSQCSSSSTVVVVQSSNKMGHVNEGSHLLLVFVLKWKAILRWVKDRHNVEWIKRHTELETDEIRLWKKARQC